MKYSIVLTAAAVVIGMSGVSAQACNPLGTKGASSPMWRIPPSMLARNNPAAPAKESIVGLWHVVHTDNSGSLLFESFDLWHSDGTEEEMPNLPPASGALCMGVWTQDGKKIQLLTHVAFTYDLSNNWTGTINITETNKVSKDGNSYSGTIDLKQYDTTGTLLGEAKGTTTADRLD